MDPTKLVSVAQKALGDKVWNVELVLRIGVQLATVVNSFPNLSGQDKTNLVCQTILKMLDDVEKAGKEHWVESTETEKTIAHLEECKKAVQTVLPVSLELVVSASRGEIVLKEQAVKYFSWCVPFSPFVKKVQETASVVENVMKHPQEYLEEMRDLVSKVERLLSSAEAKSVSPPQPASPESVDVSLPGVSATPLEVVELQ